MSRFESPVHVLALFVIASFLSVGIIYLINAEQESRIRHSGGVVALPLQDTRPQVENGETFLSYASTGLSNFLSHLKNVTLKVESLLRNKRSSRIEISENQEKHAKTREGGRKFGSAGSERRDTSDFHRIRHALKKLDNGGLDGDALYRMILDSNPPEKNPQKQKQHQGTPKPDERPPPHYYFQFQEDDRPTSPQIPSTPQIPESLQVTAAELHTRAEMSQHAPENEEGGIELSGQIPFTKEIKEKAPPPFNGSSGESQVRRAAVEVDVCYGTDDVLIVIGITCSLNFAFVLLIYACVRWFSNSKEKELNSLDVNDDDDEGGGGPLDDEEFWISTGGNGRRKFNTTSLYAIKQDLALDGLRKSHSYSMEDLRFTKNS